MPDKDTVFPYDDEVADPYSDDDTKNPHEESGEPAPEPEEKPKPANGRRTRTAKKA